MSDLGDFFSQQPFFVDSVEPQADYEIIPPGKYVVAIEKAEVQQTKKGTGHFIYLEMAVVDGQYLKRKVFDRINIDNPNAQCVEIGLRCLAALGKAIGLQVVSSVNELVNQVVVAHVKVKNDQNEVRTYSPVGANPAPPAAPVAPVVAPIAPVVAPIAPVASSPPSVAPVAPVAPVVAPAVLVAPATYAAPVTPAAPPAALTPGPATNGPSPPWKRPQ